MKRTLKQLQLTVEKSNKKIKLDSSKDEKAAPTKKVNSDSSEKKAAGKQRSKLLINKDGAKVEYFPAFLTKKEAKVLFDLLLEQADWQRDTFKMAGKETLSPRLVAAFAEEEGSAYYYTGQTRVAQQWIPELKSLCDRIEEQTGEKFNYVLLNRYDNGQNYIGWHSDKRTNLKPGSSIVSVSLGQERTFQFKRISTKVTEVNQDLPNVRKVVRRFFGRSFLTNKRDQNAVKGKKLCARSHSKVSQRW